MNEIVAAMIIACSNLTNGGNYPDRIQEIANQKATCVQRVAKCVNGVIDRRFMTEAEEKTKVLQCSSEVHL
jgi:hypothetical protein